MSDEDTNRFLKALKIPLQIRDYQRGICTLYKKR